MSLVHRSHLAGLAVLGVLVLGSLFSGSPALAAGAPEAPVSEPASGVTATTAVLHGTLNPHAKALTGWYFAYSLEAECALNGYASEPQPETEVMAQSEQTEITGLEPNKQYSFCLVAENAAQETTAGSSLTFKTKTMPPAVESENALEVNSTDAQLEGGINPENEETTYHFEYASETVDDGEQLVNATTIPGGTLTAVFGSQPVGPLDIGGGLQSGKVYYYRVIAENAAHEKGEGPVQSFQTTSTPTIAGEEAQDPTGTRVLLSATLNPLGLETRYHFAYIDQTGYETALAQGSTDPYAVGSGTPEEIMGATYESQTLSPVFVSELKPGTTYHYALVATNTNGSVTGPDETFATAPATPPIVSTGTANSIAQSIARLSATVDTNGLQTIYGFETGTEAGTYGPVAGVGSLGGATTQIVTLNLEDLQPGTTYHYRITATNLDGTVYGTDATFTTAGFPTLLTPQSAPPLIAVPTIAFPIETGAQTGVGKTEPKELTNAQKLAAALKKCAKKPKNKRTACQRQAHKRYEPAKWK